MVSVVYREHTLPVAWHMVEAPVAHCDRLLARNRRARVWRSPTPGPHRAANLRSLSPPPPEVRTARPPSATTLRDRAPLRSDRTCPNAPPPVRWSRLAPAPGHRRDRSEAPGTPGPLSQDHNTHSHHPENTLNNRDQVPKQPNRVPTAARLDFQNSAVFGRAIASKLV